MYKKGELASELKRIAEDTTLRRKISGANNPPGGQRRWRKQWRKLGEPKGTTKEHRQSTARQGSTRALEPL